METLKVEDVIGIFEEIKSVIIENKDYLISLDSVMGDGDLGLTMSAGFTAIVEELPKIEGNDLGNLIMKSGMVMANAVPSTMGTLIATAIMRSGKVVKGKTEIELGDIVNMGNAAIEGIIQRGKAKRGEKTILDSLYPAVEGFEEVSKKGGTLKEAVRAGYDGAALGTEETKEMKAVHGRAVWFAEKSIGLQDAGATVGMFIMEGILKYVDKSIHGV